MTLANEQIKANAKATSAQVAEVIKSVAPEKDVCKEKLPQKIYVGPNIPGLPKYTVVESLEIPHVQNIIKDCAAVEKLFIPIEKMAEVEVRVATKGTLEHRHLNKVIEFINAKRKGDQ